MRSNKFQSMIKSERGKRNRKSNEERKKAENRIAKMEADENADQARQFDEGSRV